MQVSIRKATANDYLPLCDLFDEVDALHRGNLPQIFQKMNDPARVHEHYRKRIDDSSDCLFVAEAGQELIGFVHVVIRDAPAIPTFVPRRYAVVESIGVKSECRSQGLGRRLMDTVHEWAVAGGATDIELNVYEFNQTALGFYESLGYKPLSQKMTKALNRK